MHTSASALDASRNWFTSQWSFGKCCSLPLGHFLILSPPPPPTIYYYHTFSHWFLYIITGIWSKKEQPWGGLVKWLKGKLGCSRCSETGEQVGLGSAFCLLLLIMWLMSDDVTRATKQHPNTRSLLASLLCSGRKRWGTVHLKLPRWSWYFSMKGIIYAGLFCCLV